MTKEKLNHTGQAYTKNEIEGQPKLWKTVYELLLSKEEEIQEFLLPLFLNDQLQIILTGAGSSAFVGEAAQGIVQKNTTCSTQDIATTDLVTHPSLYFQPNKPTLLVSFARSGNSPESLEAVNLANEYCGEIYHLFITCNKEGKLMEYAAKNQENAFAILLPEASNDKSLAMTGSFTSMLLSILLVGGHGKFSEKTSEVEKIVKQGNHILDSFQEIKEIAAKDFDRAVFLGSGAMLGIARECHLKLQELTDGQIICKFDSFLGFRHGPRVVTNEKTLLVYLFSPNDHVYQYELDLARSIAKDPRNIACVSVGRQEDQALNTCFNIDLETTPDQEWNIIPATLIGQILGYYKSIELNLDPDNPSVSGTINRVVQGVTIYEAPKKIVVK